MGTNKPIEVVAISAITKSIQSIRFRVESEDAQEHVYKIDGFRIREKNQLKIVYECAITDIGIKRRVELQYNFTTMHWTLLSIK